MSFNKPKRISHINTVDKSQQNRLREILEKTKKIDLEKNNSKKIGSVLHKFYEKSRKIEGIVGLFKQISLNPLNYSTLIQKYLEDEPITQKERDVLINLSNFDKDLVNKVALEFLRQNKPLEIFFEEYLFGESSRDIQTQEIVSKTALKTILLDEGEINLTSEINKTFYTLDKSQRIKDYTFFFKTIPWIKNKVTGIYLKPLSSNLNEDFYIKTQKYFFNNEVFYKPKDKFYRLQGSFSTIKTQNDDVLKIVGSDGEFILKLGFLIEDETFIVQNEEIFVREQDFLENWGGNLTKRRNQLLASTSICEETKETCKLFLRDAFTLVVGKTFESIYNSKVLSVIIDKTVELSENTFDFIDRISNLLIYTNPQLSFVTSTIFSKRLAKFYYNPEILPLLTEKEKMPEIFDDQHISPKTLSHVVDVLNEQRKKLNEEITESILMYNVIPQNKNTMPKIITGNNNVQRNNLIIGLPEWKKYSENYNDIKDVSEEKLIYYNEDSIIYGFEINNLIDKFIKNDYINEISGKQFSASFIKHFSKIYNVLNKDIISREINHDYSQEEIIEKQIEKGILIELIEKEIALFENLKNGDDKQKKCNSCNDIVGNNAIESVRRGEVVKFCDIECLEKKW